jgi:2-polyprenyl-3-methyl-5-hydroxy-6-metoxy-1,4-benzoquinol methylase
MHTPPNSQAEWNARYLESEQIWSGNPNAALVREITGMTPGRALDLGCGEGADAIWLARQGWSVTGVDVSDVALDRARQHAAAAGVRIAFALDDLVESPGEFDLVTSFFLHVPEAALRERTLLVAAASVAPGGTLLVVGHSGTSGHTHLRLETADEVVGLLRLAADGWVVEVAADVERAATNGHTTDTVVRARRI